MGFGQINLSVDHRWEFSRIDGAILGGGTIRQIVTSIATNANVALFSMPHESLKHTQP